MIEYLSQEPWLLSLAVFLARVVDVSLGTMRTIMVFRAFRLRAALIGFVEVLVWVCAASAVLRDLSAWYVAVAYAGGFATGNFVGIVVESKLAMGMEMVRVISSNPEVRLAEELRGHTYSVTQIAGTDGEEEPVEVLLVVDERRKIPALIQAIEALDPEAVYTRSDVKFHRRRNRAGRMVRK